MREGALRSPNLVRSRGVTYLLLDKLGIGKSKYPFLKILKRFSSEDL